MARITWKENKVISIQLDEHTFVLAQMIVRPYLIFFNIFNSNNEWSDIDLNLAPILFTNPVTNQFLSSSKISTVNHVNPKSNFSTPQLWLEQSPEFQYIKIWENTEYELDVCMFGAKGVRVIEKNITLKGQQTTKPITNFVDANEIEDIHNYEFNDIAVNPETSERLKLCYKFNRNVDPCKELLLGNEIPLDYWNYFKTISKPI